MIHISSDWSEADREIDRIESMPDHKMRAELDGVLQAGFALTQAAVHVQSGALKSSGRVESKTDQAQDQWEGEISYGEADTAVDYAIYEKRRGVHWAGASAAKGDHDFMEPLDAIDPMFVAAIKSGLSK